MAGAKRGRKKQQYPTTICSICLGYDSSLQTGKTEELISCTECGASGHPSCLLFTPKLVANVKQYPWTCIECKMCEVCSTPGNDECLLFCDTCDRGYHTFCLRDGMKVPEDDWTCALCLPPKKAKAPKETPLTIKIKGRRPKDIDIIGSEDDEEEEQAQEEEQEEEEEEEEEEQEEEEADDYSESEEEAVQERPKKKKQTPKKNVSASKKMKKAPKSDSSTKRPTTIKWVCFGPHRLASLYTSPYPDHSRRDTLYVCDRCFSFSAIPLVSRRHVAKCRLFSRPPGDEIYRDGKLSVFEVHGRTNTLYCQNLCLFAKMFLDHKTLLYDVEPFIFYVMMERESDENGGKSDGNDLKSSQNDPKSGQNDDKSGQNDTKNGPLRFVGYFSKERLRSNHNVCCIVVLPLFQGKGYGQWLIAFSYALSRRQGEAGTPERPLSELGARSYASYWKYAVARALGGGKGELRELGVKSEGKETVLPLERVMRATGMVQDDILQTLASLGWSRDEPADASARLHVVVNVDQAARVVSEYERRNVFRVNDECLRWTPPHP